MISSDRGPTSEFAHAKTAVPVDVRNPDALTAAVRSLMDDRCRRRDIAAAGHAEAHRRGWANIWDELFAGYAAALTPPIARREPTPA